MTSKIAAIVTIGLLLLDPHPALGASCAQWIEATAKTVKLLGKRINDQMPLDRMFSFARSYDWMIAYEAKVTFDNSRKSGGLKEGREIKIDDAPKSGYGA